MANDFQELNDAEIIDMTESTGNILVIGATANENGSSGDTLHDSGRESTLAQNEDLLNQIQSLQSENEKVR